MTQYLSEINRRKKLLFNEIREYFNKKYDNSAIGNYFYHNRKGIKLGIGLKNYEEKDDENKNYLNIFTHNNSFIKEKEGDNQFNSLIQTHSYIDNNNSKEGGNVFSESIQNISKIENINSEFLFGLEEENNDN